MKDCVGIAAVDFIPATYSLGWHLKELCNFDEVVVEIIEFKRIGIFYFSHTHHGSNKLEEQVGTAMIIFREHWNGSLLNIHLPTVYEAALHEQPMGKIDKSFVVYDITFRPWAWKSGQRQKFNRYYYFGDKGLTPTSSEPI